MRSVLRRPGVARLALAGLAPEVGDWLLLVALPRRVLAPTGSPLVTATVFVLELVPSVLAGPLAGVVVERVDRWRLLAAAGLVQAVLLLPLLAADAAERLWVVYTVVVAQALLATLVEPARVAAAAALVGPDEQGEAARLATW